MQNEDILNNENFKKWFAKSTILDDNDEPLILYHGTTAEFYKFDINKTNPESFAGKGFYFSSCINDATNNYANINGPDFKAKREGFVEKIKGMVDTLCSSEEENIEEAKESQNNFQQFIEELIEEEVSYTVKISKIDEYLDKKHLILSEDSNDSTEYLEKIFLQLVEQKNNGLVHSVYLKVENPFYLDKHTWEKSFELDDNIISIFEDFKKINPENNFLVNDLLNNLQYYSDIESEDYLSINKSSFFESIDVDLNILESDDFEHYNYSKKNLLELSEYWDLKIGEEDYLVGNYTNNNIVEQFKTYVEDNYGHDISDHDLKQLHSFYIQDSETIYAKIFFNKLKEDLYFFYDYNHKGLTHSNVFFEFIYSLGFDGIVMETKRFYNMNLEEDTKHYIVKNSNQIKLAEGLNTDFSEYNDDIRFKKVLCKPDISLTQNEAFATIEKFHLSFPNLPYTRIFQTQKDIEKFSNTKDKVAGFYHTANNKPFVGIVLENIKSPQQLEKVLIHEHLGHASLRNILGQNFDTTMMSIFQYLKKTNAITVNPEWNKSQKIEIAEEFFANSMETKNEHSTTLLSKISAAVSKVIRSVFSNFPFSKEEFSVLQEKTYLNSKTSKSIKTPEGRGFSIR